MGIERNHRLLSIKESPAFLLVRHIARRCPLFDVLQSQGYPLTIEDLATLAEELPMEAYELAREDEESPEDGFFSEIIASN